MPRRPGRSCRRAEATRQDEDEPVARREASRRRIPIRNEIGALTGRRTALLVITALSRTAIRVGVVEQDQQVAAPGAIPTPIQ